MVEGRKEKILENTKLELKFAFGYHAMRQSWRISRRPPAGSTRRAARRGPQVSLWGREGAPPLFIKFI